MSGYGCYKNETCNIKIKVGQQSNMTSSIKIHPRSCCVWMYCFLICNISSHNCCSGTSISRRRILHGKSRNQSPTRLLKSMNKGEGSKTIYAYPDILNGNEECIIDDNYPDFMSLSSNMDKFLFTNIDDCCQAHGYICTSTTQEDTVTPPLKGEEVLSLANSTEPPHKAPLKREEAYKSHIMHPPHTGPDTKSKSTPASAVDSIVNSPDKEEVSIVEGDELDMLYDDLMSFSMSLYFNTKQPSPSPTADSTAVSSKQLSLEISSSESIEAESADTVQFDPIKYMLLMVPLALAVVASMFYRRRRMIAIEEVRNICLCGIDGG